MKILDAEAMREVDRRAIEEIGIPSLVLMENAAIGLADAIGEGYPEAASVAIFCGPGNNGGDGLALARHLDGRGYHVEIVVITGSRPLAGDAAVQLEICRRQGLSLLELGPEDRLQEAIRAAATQDLVVDALFGTGLKRELSGHFAAWVTAINSLEVPCLAVDLPSGLQGSSAHILGPHIQSELTVTFAAPKIAHIFSPAADAVGQVAVADLGIPAQLLEEAAGDLYLLTAEDLRGLLPRRSPSGHKGDFGHAVILAGSVGKSGAAILAARAAVRAGAGLVTVATPRAVANTVDLGSIESMTLPLETDRDGGLAATAAGDVLDFAAGKEVVAIGPGLGTAASTVAAVRQVVLEASAPVVLDADGLNAFAGELDRLRQRRGDLVLTPHPGELARMLGVATSQIQGDRLASAREAARRSGAVVVLKGQKTLVAEPQGAVHVNPTGNPGMASGGTGDVLTGILTGLLSQGLSPTDASCLAVFAHGRSGDRALAQSGEQGLAASDLLPFLPEVWSDLQS